MWGQNFITLQDKIEFTDIRSNIKFNGVLKDKKNDLTLSFLTERIEIDLTPLPYDQWQIGEHIENTNKEASLTYFSKLVFDIKNDTLEGTHAIIISQYGEIIFEKYFDRFTPSTPHDTWSLSKGFASAIVGIAITDQNLRVKICSSKTSLKSNTL